MLTFSIYDFRTYGIQNILYRRITEYKFTTEYRTLYIDGLDGPTRYKRDSIHVLGTQWPVAYPKLKQIFNSNESVD